MIKSRTSVLISTANTNNITSYVRVNIGTSRVITDIQIGITKASIVVTGSINTDNGG